MNSFFVNPKMRCKGFTLVELLLVMAIIGILSGLALVVVNEAQYDAQATSTRSRISMLDQILRQRVEILHEMRVPIDFTDFEVDDRLTLRSLRRRTIADIIDAEFPRSYFDIAYGASDPMDTTEKCIFPSRSFSDWILNNADLEGTYGDNGYDIQDDIIATLAGRPPANSRRFKLNESPLDNPDIYPEGGSINDTAFVFDINDPDSIDYDRLTSVSEYLYVILQSTQFNGISAVESLSNRAFADTDGDGFLEVVDAWGIPIAFQFELYFDNGDPAALNLDAGAGLEDSVFDVENLRIRLVSTGGRKSATDSTQELITN